MRYIQKKGKDMESKVKISSLTFIAFYINGAAGSGDYAHITISQVFTAMENRTIFEFLEEKLGNDIDLSLLSSEQRLELSEEWESIANAVDHERKFCVRKGGLNLVIAYILQSIQLRMD